MLVWTIRRQRSLKLRAHLMQEAMRNHDFTFRLPTDGLLPGERAMQQTLNQLGETIHQQVNQSEVESWERLTRVLTHEMMNATAPITSISQSLLGRTDVKGTPLEPGIQAIYDTSRHLSDFVANYRKMSELEKPMMADLPLRPLLDDVCKAYPELTWQISIPDDLIVSADAGMLRQVIMNLAKNAAEAQARKIVIEIAPPIASDWLAPSSRRSHDSSLFTFPLHWQRRSAHPSREPPVALRTLLHHQAQRQWHRPFPESPHDDSARRHARACRKTTPRMPRRFYSYDSDK